MRCSRSLRRLQIRAVRTGLDAKRYSNSASFSHPRKAEFLCSHAEQRLASRMLPVQSDSMDVPSDGHLTMLVPIAATRAQRRCFGNGGRAATFRAVPAGSALLFRTKRMSLRGRMATSAGRTSSAITVRSFTRIGVTKSAVFVSTAFLSDVGDDQVEWLRNDRVADTHRHVWH